MFSIFLGMVTVCAGCDAFRPWVAVLLGACGGSLYLVASLLLVKLKIDDPLDASAIHASCGKENKSIFQPDIYKMPNFHSLVF